MLFGQVGNTIISLVSIVVLSRLLDPSDFGLIAMVGVLSTLGVILRDLGMTVSTLRVQSLTHQQASNVFWINAAFSVASAGLVAASGPLMARIYAEPAVASITPFMALAMLLGGLQAQPQVQLARAQRYRVLAVIGVASNLVGLAVAIVCAWSGMGYWALVLQNVAIGVISLAAKFGASKWLPLRWKSRSGTKDLITSGMNYTGTTVVNMFADNAPAFFLGFNLGPESVGLFGRADQLIRMPMKFVTPLVNVALPGLNSLQSEGKPLGPYVVRMQGIMAVSFSLFIVPLAASAPTVFPLILGPQWSGAAPPARLLAMGGIALAMSQVSYWAFLVAVRSSELLKYNLVVKPLTFLLVGVGSSVSLLATSAALSFASIISWAWGVHWLRKKSGMCYLGLFRNGVRVLLAGAVALAVAMLLDSHPSNNGALLGAMQAVLSVAVFSGTMAVTAGGRAELHATWRFFIGAVNRSNRRGL